MTYFITLGQYNSKFKMYVLYNQNYEFQCLLSMSIEKAKEKANAFVIEAGGILELKVSDKAESSNKFKMPSGKYKGANVLTVFDTDPDYLYTWMLNSKVPNQFRRQCDNLYLMLIAIGIPQKYESYQKAISERPNVNKKHLEIRNKYILENGE